MNKNHIEEVKKILTEWNPLGEYANQISDLNNYETEAIDILFYLDSKSSIERISKMTTEVLSQAFSININPSESRKCAEKIRRILIMNNEPRYT
ncbi:MAG: hypothetical protein K8R58_02720 [Bacteroidales bacterium]|nr:hypothetical protein [Bacteroidales bacterium]